MAIYGELGRYPLYINRYTRIIKFWCKIIYSDNIIIIKKLYEDMLLTANSSWAKQVKLLLDSYGFTYIWINPDSVNLTTFHALFTNCVLDNFKQAWWQNICNSGTLCTYKYLKTSLSIEAYLDISLASEVGPAGAALAAPIFWLYAVLGPRILNTRVVCFITKTQKIEYRVVHVS